MYNFKHTPAQARKLWAKALRSGKYKQTTGRLCELVFRSPSYCCLGVACVLYNRHAEPLLRDKHGRGVRGAVKYDSFDGCTYLPPQQVSDWLGIDDQEQFVDANDTLGQSFAQIADRIDKPSPIHCFGRLPSALVDTGEEPFVFVDGGISA